MWSFSITYFTTIILLVNLNLAINTTYWIFLHWIAFIPLSFMLYVCYFFVSNYLSSTWAFMTPIILIRVMHFYLTVVLGLLFFFLVDYLIFTIPNLIFKNLSHKLVDYAKKQRLGYQTVNGSPANNGSQDNNNNMNSMNYSQKQDDVDEKIDGEIELVLQNHASVEKPANLNNSNILKL